MSEHYPLPSKTGGGLSYTTQTRDVEPEFNDLVVGKHVPDRYLGTEADKRDMLAQGKRQELRRNFKLLTMTGFASMVVCAWEGMLAYLYFPLTDGGTGLLFWGFIAVMIGMLLVYLSVAEMSSISPTSAGQYHWVSEFAPPRHQRWLSYCTGWLCAIGWQTFLASVCFLTGTIIQGLIALNDESYIYQRWHGTLLTIAIIVFSIVFNTTLAGKLPLTEGIAVIVHICGLFAVMIPLWALAPRATAYDAFLTFENNGGWPTTGLSCMIGLTAPLTILIGYDCSAHMSEEIQDASINLPKSIIAGFFLNGALAFLIIVTVIFTMGDGSALLTSVTGYPFIQLFYNSVRSKPATNVMTFLIIFSFTNCAISETATASRQIWSFARDNGLPASTWLSKVSPGQNIPFRAVLVSLAATTLLSLINIGSTVALNAITSLASVSLLTSYLITIGCLIWRRLYGNPLPPRQWSLGRWGLAINIASICFLIPVWFFAFWPLALPVTAADMNWSSTVFGAVLIVAAVYWFARGRHVYTGPVAQMKREE